MSILKRMNPKNDPVPLIFILAILSVIGILIQAA